MYQSKIDTRRYLPWELTARLALLGYNEDSYTTWAKPRAMTKPWTAYCLIGRSWPKCNFPSRDPNDFDSRRGVLKRYEHGPQNYHALQWAFAHVYLATVTPDEAKEWFRKNYDIDFFERPHIGRDKKYICDPLGGGLTDTRLEAKSTPREALEACLSFLVNKVKPLPLEELEEEEDPETCEVSSND